MRGFLPIKNDKAMMAVFGNSRVFPGVVSDMFNMLKLNSSYDMNKVKNYLFSKTYVTDKVFFGNSLTQVC